jgi:hypothetical protein
MDRMMETTTLLIWIAFVIAAVTLGPLATIWSINTLFVLTIPYTLETWGAVVWLTMVTFGNVVSTIRDKK